jgi:hypothetical protein
MCFADRAIWAVDKTPHDIAGPDDQRTLKEMLCHLARSCIGPGATLAGGGVGEAVGVYITTRTASGPGPLPHLPPANGTAVTRAHVLAGQASRCPRPPTVKAWPWAVCLWGGQSLRASRMPQLQHMWVCPGWRYYRVRFQISQNAANAMAVHGALPINQAAAALACRGPM